VSDPAQRDGGIRTAPAVLRFGAVELRLELVTQLEDHVDRDALLRDADAPEPPYWMHLWTGGRALARLVASSGDWRGRRVVDVGCGLGLAGLVAARLGAHVLLLDRAPDALRLARWNAEENGCRVDLLLSDAAAPGLRGRFDAVLLADVTYDPALQVALARFAAEHLAPTGVVLAAESVRNHDPGFRRACESLGLVVREREVREEEDGRPLPVRITEVRR
jgi:predicted nicotinamide N-methyase